MHPRASSQLNHLVQQHHLRGSPSELSKQIWEMAETSSGLKEEHPEELIQYILHKAQLMAIFMLQYTQTLIS